MRFRDLNRRSIAISAISIAAAIACIAILRGSIRRRDPLAPIRGVAQNGEIHLSGYVSGLPHAAHMRGTRSKSLAVSAAVAGVLAAADSTSRTDLHATGIARLVGGELDAAVAALTEATEGRNVPAGNWNDLAAALIERGMHDDNREDFARALGAADRALRNAATMMEAKCNRATALGQLGLADAAEAAAEQCTHDGAYYSRGIGGTSARTEDWRRVAPRLAAAVAARDANAIRGFVRMHPQAARTWAETEYLNEWAEAFLKKDVGGARAKLELARAIGEVLRTSTGERLLADAVASIDAALRRNDAAHVAAAHKEYRDGRLDYSRRRVMESASHFDSARDGFSAASSPMVLLAEYYRANVLYDSNRADEALALVRLLISRAPDGYRALHAQLRWTEGTVLLNHGQLRSALTSYETALQIFQELGERENAASIRDNAATTLANLGRHGDAWRLRSAAFAEASDTGDSPRLQFALLMAARQAIRQRQWDVAWSMLTLSLDIPGDNQRLRADALQWRALALWRSGESGNADLAAAREAVRTIPDAEIRKSAEADLHLAQGIIAAESAPREAIDELLAVVSFANHTKKKRILPAALLLRAEAYRRLGELERAESDLQQAASAIEREHGSIAEPDLRDVFLGTARGIFEGLIDVRLAQQNEIGAFEAAELMRSRRFLDEIRINDVLRVAEPVPARELIATLPAGIVIACYTAVGDRLLLFSATRGNVRLAASNIGTGDVERLQKRLIHGIEKEDSRGSDAAASELYDLLIAPLANELQFAEKLIIVSDTPTSGIPFAVLHDREERRFLIERLCIIMAPSASAWLRSMRETVSGSNLRALIIGSPEIDTASYPNLEALPEARREAETIASLYETDALTGDSASISRVTSELPGYDIVHIATHAVTERADAALSSLIFARTQDAPGALHVRDIVRLKLPRRPLIILAACRTGTVRESEESVRSLALAFLAAGGRTVIATLWDIEDAAAAQLMLDLHNELRAGVPPAEALRQAQREALRRNASRATGLRTWSTFQTYGAGQ